MHKHRSFLLHRPCFRDVFCHLSVWNSSSIWECSQSNEDNNVHTLFLTGRLLCAFWWSFWWSQVNLIGTALFFISRSSWISFTCNFNLLLSSSKLCICASGLSLFPHSEVFSNCHLSSWEGFGGRVGEWPKEGKKEKSDKICLYRMKLAASSQSKVIS